MLPNPSFISSSLLITYLFAPYSTRSTFRNFVHSPVVYKKKKFDHDDLWDRFDDEIDELLQNSSQPIPSSTESELDIAILQGISEPEEIASTTIPTIGDVILNASEILDQISKNNRPLPKLKDSDIDQKFITGFGKGGQKLNKTANCVQLKHKPTGIVVKCQKTRDQKVNRKLAHRLLRLKVDEFLFQQQSKVQIQQSKLTAKIRKAKNRARRRARKRQELQRNEHSAPPHSSES